MKDETRSCWKIKLHSVGIFPFIYRFFIFILQCQWYLGYRWQVVTSNDIIGNRGTIVLNFSVMQNGNCAIVMTMIIEIIEIEFNRGRKAIHLIIGHHDDHNLKSEINWAETIKITVFLFFTFFITLIHVGPT